MPRSRMCRWVICGASPRRGGVRGELIPTGVHSRLADNRVVLLGETHHDREPWAFVAKLVSDLNHDGFRQSSSNDRR